MRKRLRSTIKWGGTVLTVLLLVVWVGSAWWVGGVRLGAKVDLAMRAGHLGIGWSEPWSVIPVDGTWFPPERHSHPFSWWFDGSQGRARNGLLFTTVFIPIWALVVLFAMPTIWLWWRDRRRRPGLCPKCGYELRGNRSGVCPECGNS